MRSRHRPRSRVGAVAPGRSYGAGKAQIPRGGRAVSGSRYYDPKQGRFVGRDPKGEAGGTHLYAFVRNNPTNRWDYLGMVEQMPTFTVNGGLRETKQEEGDDGCLYELTYQDMSNDPAYGIEDMQLVGRVKISCPMNSDPDGTSNTSDQEPDKTPNPKPPKPPKNRCDELQKSYGQYLSAESGGVFSAREDAQKAMIINAALGQAEGFEYASRVIDLTALAARNGVDYSGPQYFTTPAFSNWMAGQPQLNANNMAWISNASDPWFTAGIGPPGVTLRSDGRPGFGYPNSTMTDTTHTHPAGGGGNMSGTDLGTHRDLSTGNAMSSHLVTPSLTVRSINGGNITTNNLIPQNDLKDLRGCFGEGRL